MLYIKKSQPSRETADDISRVKRELKPLISRGTSESAREAFDCLNKSLLRGDLITEQHGLCAYCMKRIMNNANMTIEHWLPIENDPARALDYDNMLGVCNGGRKINEADSERTYHILCCDASKKSQEITISPYNSEHMSKIAILKTEKYILTRKMKHLRKISMRFYI